MSYPISPTELLIENFNYHEWISTMKKQLESLNIKAPFINVQLKLLDELQDKIKQHQLYQDSMPKQLVTLLDVPHIADKIRTYDVPRFNLLLKTILYMRLSLSSDIVYYKEEPDHKLLYCYKNKVYRTGIYCQILVDMYKTITKMLHLEFPEDNTIGEIKRKIYQQNINNYVKEPNYHETIEYIIKNVQLIQFKIDIGEYHKICDKYQHEIEKGYYNCICQYPILNHKLNTVVCDNLRSDCRKCCGRDSIKYICNCCGLNRDLHKIDYYCICNIKGMDAQTLKLHYIKCMDSTLTVETMPTKYFTKYSITEALKNKVKIIVPLHEIKQSKPKKSISASLRQKVWNQYIGLSVGETLCKCCNTNTISQLRFHCGHVTSEACGGETNLENLRPICDKCNLSMGTQNLNEFAKTLI
jgi:hypothetical protein